MRKLITALLATVGSGAVALPAAAQTTVNWNFAGTHTGAGQLTYDGNDVVTAFSGSYDSQMLSLVSFSSDPNNPTGNVGNSDGAGHYTYHTVPNTGGVDYIFDNKLPVTDNGILVSTRTGAGERVYDISTENGVVDFFSVDPNGSYVDDFGKFTTAATPSVPEPASWAMMILGVGAVGLAMRRRIRRSEEEFDAKIKSMTESAA